MTRCDRTGTASMSSHCASRRLRGPHNLSVVAQLRHSCHDRTHTALLCCRHVCRQLCWSVHKIDAAARRYYSASGSPGTLLSAAWVERMRKLESDIADRLAAHGLCREQGD
eukprot:1520210-Prymnesium_polylepis.1